LEKLRVAREKGFHRVSFGVQSLNQAVLKRIHRGGQTEEMVRKAVRQALDLGFECVSVELVLGLKGDTVESFMQSVVKLLDERPTSLCINQLNLVQDYMTEENIEPKQYFAWRRELLPKICEALKLEATRRGYSTEYISPTRGIWTLSRGDDFYSNALGKNYCEPFSTVLGIGQRAFSQIRGQVWYERVYSDFSTDQPIYKMRRRSLDIEAAEYALFSLINYSAIEFKPFFEVFGVDLRKHYELELKILASLEKIRIGPDGLKFLPTDLKERFFYGSVFFLRQWANLSAGKALLGSGFLEELRTGLS
jgi:coproporphyrinogen III oxidase-like Fe-S oxidoreductase